MANRLAVALGESVETVAHFPAGLAQLLLLDAIRDHPREQVAREPPRRVLLGDRQPERVGVVEAERGDAFELGLERRGGRRFRRPPAIAPPPSSQAVRAGAPLATIR